MNCTGVATIMDEHAQARLTAAERCALDEHLAGCEACALAWHAQNALLTLPIPGTPRSLLEDVLRAVSPGAPTKPARARARIVVAAALLVAGVALAAAAFVTFVQRSHGGSRGGPAAASAASSAEPSDPGGQPGAAPPTDADAAALGAGAPRPPFEPVDVDYSLVVRTPPDYPPEALKRKLDGWVQVKFTIGENGAVEDAIVVNSDEPLFEGAALRAVANFKYLPRVVAGKRVAARDVHTLIRFTMQSKPPPNADKKKSADRGTPQPSDEPRADAIQTANVGVERGIAIAWERVATKDLRGAELELDELRATYELSAAQEGAVSDFYGYIFTQYGDYGRAIAAYENSIAAYESAGVGLRGERVALANLYFARHQYDMALKTLLAANRKAQVGGPPILARSGPEPAIPRLENDAEALMEKLRALGVTEETL